MMERWMVPSLILTALSWIAVFALMPYSGFSGVPPFFSMLPYWMLLSGALALGYGFIEIVRMMLSGEGRPFARIRALDWKRVAFIAGGALIAGLHMVAFMSIKPQLNNIVDFWADPLLADVDAFVFFGDPWRYVEWLNSAAMADVYHALWFAGIVAVLIWQLSRPESIEKSSNLLAYFVIWSLGPVVHCLLPAAGPIFYMDLGVGDRFAALNPPEKVRIAADYLWSSYIAQRFAPGSGISAMPSLHIATVCWAVLCNRGTRWFWPSVAAGGLIWMLSVSLGWHYAVDGVAGALLAFLCQRIMHRFLCNIAVRHDLKYPSPD